jgi:hypothetical protein
MNFNFGEILVTSWKTVWRRKILFAYGILPMAPSALIGIVIGAVFIYLNFESVRSGVDPFEQFFQPGLLFESVSFAFLGFALLIMLLVFVLTAISWTAIATGTAQVDSGREPLTFSSLWHDSMPFFWRVLGAFLLIGGLTFIIFMFIMMIPVGADIITNASIAYLCILPMMCFMIPLAFLVGMGLNLSIASIVVDDRSLTDAIAHTWNVVLKNIWSLVLMTLILYFIQWLVGMLASAPFSAVQYSFMGFMNEQTDPLELFNFFGIFIMISTPILAFIQSLGYTYTQTAWTLTYLRLTQKPETPETLVFAEPNA